MANKITNKLKAISGELFIAWAIIIAFMTLIPGGAIPHFNWNFLSFDKWIHFIAFLILSTSGMFAFTYGRFRHLVQSPIIISLITAFGYGVSLEFAQAFIPERTFDYADMLANTGGAIGGYLLYRVMNFMS